MATPSKAQTTSTPKPVPTPTKMMPSPRPGTTANLSRNVSHKSPAMKTPASTHSHQHNISISSHPSSTPIAALAQGDDALATSSPIAAFTPFLGAPALTPLPIPASLQVSPTKPISVNSAQEAEANRLARLQEVARTLRSRIMGRGITRGGVERVAQLNDLTTLWDEDILTIAGNNYVDLEILFDNMDADRVKDVNLKLKEARQDDASDLLKEDLSSTRPRNTEEPWNSLENFAKNVGYLAQLDALSIGVNCFEAIDGLYSSFTKIWEEEKKRLTWRTGLQHLSRGNVGRPRMNRKRKLGLVIEYWAEKQKFFDKERTHSQVTMDDVMMLEDEDYNSEFQLWTAHISCELGYPSLKVSRDWVSSATLTDADAGDVQDPKIHKKTIPDWLEPEPMLISGPDGREESDAMDIDGTKITIPRTPNARFIFAPDPVLHLPLGVVSAFETKGLSMTADQSKVTTYQEALRRTSNVHDTKVRNLSQDKHSARFDKSLVTYDSEGGKQSCHHIYALYSKIPTWCYPVESVAFVHPRQLVELLPTFRQYALLWTILRKLASNPDPANHKPGVSQDKNHAVKVRSVKKRNNFDVRRAKLDAILKDLGSSTTEGYQGSSIDISIDFTGTAPALNPKLDIIVPLVSPHNLDDTKTRLGSISVEISPNADIRILSTQGLGSLNSEAARRKMAKILRLSEDLGVLVEWLLQQRHER